MTTQDGKPPYGTPFQASAAILGGSTPQVQLQWPVDPGAMYYRIFHRVTGQTDWGTPIDLIAGTATSWTDPFANTGTAYDYMVQKRYNVAGDQILPRNLGANWERHCQCKPNACLSFIHRKTVVFSSKISICNSSAT
jgi:hypothetical protein